MLENILLGLNSILYWQIPFYMIAGVFVGIFVGAVPGLTTSLGIALMMPFTFYMPVYFGIPFLLGIYKGGMYGGSISAILINTPGTSAACATLFDGYPLARQGKAGKALSMALYASVIGNSISDLIVLLFIGPLSVIAMKVGRPEFFMILVFSVSMLGTVVGKNVLRGLLSGAIGLFLSTVGIDAIAGTTRFTFGNIHFADGVPFIAVIMGLFGLSEIITQIGRELSLESGISSLSFQGENHRVSWKELKSCRKAIGIGSAVGMFIGAIPGIGQPIAAMLSYTMAKRSSSNPDKFGEGSLEGVAAAESGNNSVNGTTLIPLFSLGVPGDTVTAILLGAFMAQGLTVGPGFVQQNTSIVYGLLIISLLGNLAFLGVGKLTIPLYSRITTIPRAILFPIILLILIAGVFSRNNSVVDIIVMIIFGILGYGLRKANIPLAPLIISFILGRPMEIAFQQSLLLLKSPVEILNRPIALFFLILTVVFTIGFPIYTNLSTKK